MRLYQRSICFLAISLFTTFAWGSTYCHSGGGYCSHLHYFEGYERAKTECNKLANVIFGKGENCSKFSPFVRGYQADKYNTASHYLWFLPIYNCPKDGQAIDRDRGCIPKNECALGYIKSSLGNYICNIPTQHAQQEAGNGNCHSPDTTPAAGNPVRIATGNKFHVESVFNDISPLILSYNSSTGKWSHSYFYELHVENGFFFERNNQRPDGQSLVFTKSGDGWTPLAAGAIQLSSTSAHGAAWLVNYYGQHEYYDDQGRILRIEKPQGTSQTFTWSDQQLVVQDQQSNRLTLNFDDKKRLVSAVQPNGKPTTLAWSDDDKLLKVTKSDGSIRQYHYENSTFQKHLTGITDGNGKRFATWKYDDKGRAISSEHAGGTEKTSLEYHANNSTTVTNPLGKKTTYHFQVFNGVHKVVKVEGQQTEHCAAANKEYTYYDNGLLKTKTDWKGNTTAFKYNDQGLAIETTEAVGTPQARTVITEWDVEKRLPLKTSDGQVETSYQYDEHGALVKKRQQLVQ